MCSSRCVILSPAGWHSRWPLHRKPPPLWASISRMVHSIQLFITWAILHSCASTPLYRLHQSGENAAKISAVPDWSQCFHCSHPTLLTAVMPAPLQKKKYKSLTITASEATHETIRAKQSWFSTTNVAVIICKDGRTGLVLQGQRQPCCSSFLLLFTASNQGKRGSESGRAGGRQGRLSASVSLWKRHTHTLSSDRETAAADWVRSLAVCGCFSPRSRPSPATPTVGGRTPETKRALRRCLPARWLTSDGACSRFVFFCLPLGFFKKMYLFKWRPRGSEAALLASCGPSTEPVSTSQEPAAQTPRPSHLGKLSWMRWKAGHPV